LDTDSNQALQLNPHDFWMMLPYSILNN